MSAHFADRLTAAIRARRTAAVVGIDPLLERLPARLRPADGTLTAAVGGIEAFSRGVIDAVAPQVPAIKINSAFFEAFYELGVALFYRLIQHAHRAGLLVIADVKRGDIGSTAKLYARGHLASPTFGDVDPQRVPDAVTLAGYLGRGAVQPFIEAGAATGRGVFVLVRPSDPDADIVHDFAGATPFYQHMAGLVREWGTAESLIGSCGLSNVGAVVAPRDEASTRALRTAMPRTPWLVPGYGAQGAGADACRACFLPGGQGAIVNASRSVIYAFESDAYKQRCGDDWQAAVALAAQDFARDIAGCVEGLG